MLTLDCSSTVHLAICVYGSLSHVGGFSGSVESLDWVPRKYLGFILISSWYGEWNRVIPPFKCQSCIYQGLWFNIKMPSYQYRKSHCGDEMVVRLSYLHNGVSYTGKMTSLYWIRTLNSAITVPADVLKPDGARPPAVTVLTTKMCFQPCFFRYHDFRSPLIHQMTSFKIVNGI